MGFIIETSWEIRGWGSKQIADTAAPAVKIGARKTLLHAGTSRGGGAGREEGDGDGDPAANDPS